VCLLPPHTSPHTIRPCAHPRGRFIRRRKPYFYTAPFSFTIRSPTPCQIGPGFRTFFFGSSAPLLHSQRHFHFRVHRLFAFVVNGVLSAAFFLSCSPVLVMVRAPSTRASPGSTVISRIFPSPIWPILHSFVGVPPTQFISAAGSPRADLTALDLPV